MSYYIRHRIGKYLASDRIIKYCDDIEHAITFRDERDAEETIDRLFAHPNVVEIIEVEDGS